MYVCVNVSIPIFCFAVSHYSLFVCVYMQIYSTYFKSGNLGNLYLNYVRQKEIYDNSDFLRLLNLTIGACSIFIVFFYIFKIK